MLFEVPRLRAWDPLRWPVADDWAALVRQFLRSPAGSRLADYLQGRLAAGATIFPATPFLALELTPLAQVKVVILGQDPYHGPGQAHGLAFSVVRGVRPPPSLRNILAEVRRGAVAGTARGGPAPDPRSGNLEHWARQGVLLLNTCLTVEQGQPGAHANKGWEVLTDILVEAVVRTAGPCVFMLWGAQAQSKRALVHACGQDATRLVLCANHPSPLSARRPPLPFVGCGHFLLANEFLERNHVAPVDWSV